MGCLSSFGSQIYELMRIRKNLKLQKELPWEKLKEEMWIEWSLVVDHNEWWRWFHRKSTENRGRKKNPERWRSLAMRLVTNEWGHPFSRLTMFHLAVFMSWTLTSSTWQCLIIFFNFFWEIWKKHMCLVYLILVRACELRVKMKAWHLVEPMSANSIKSNNIWYSVQTVSYNNSRSFTTLYVPH